MVQSGLVSIVTVNYKQPVVTRQLLESLMKITWQPLEILVVENGTGINESGLLKNSYPNVRIIQSEKNLGFAGGNNLGIMEAKGEFILLLNNDTEVDVNFIQPLVKRLQSDLNIGVVSPKIKFFDTPDTIQYAGFTSMNKITLRMKALGNHEKDNERFDIATETQFAHGCALMFKREVLDKAGLMPEQYFLYYEEQDWCLSIKNAGYKIWYEPKSTVYHKESVSVQKNSPLKTYFLNRNRVLFMRRNITGIYKAIAILYILMVSLPKNSIQFILKNNWKNLSAYWKGLLWNVSFLYLKSK